MTAQIYPDKRIVRIFDDGNRQRDGEAIADLPLPLACDIVPAHGSRALMKLGLVRIGGWKRTDWGWEIEVQLRST